MDSRGRITHHSDVTRVALFPTCLGDVVARQTVADARDVLGRIGCTVDDPRAATCCGQPGFNSGHLGPARAVAAATLREIGRAHV